MTSSRYTRHLDPTRPLRTVSISLYKAIRGGEGCFLPVLFLHFHLPVTACQVKGQKPLRACQRIQVVVDSRKQVGVIPGYIVQLPVVDAKQARPILLLHEDDKGRPGAARRLHDVSSQHFFQEGFHLRSLVVGDPHWGAPHLHGIAGVHGVAYHTRPPEVLI
ncbi:hypothetical protein T07_8932 [Trichinella nelsoni]|uniref:Uncharacterized protein n=1 Tax=Trichinella nelsoni TaxID=6336 RepID=A0A0V0SKD4_9BILA|nr:hypothetical protein T07_8932 [Trichinella nelsoni]